MSNICCAPIIQMGSKTEYYLGQTEIAEGGKNWVGSVVNYLFDKLDYDFACSSVDMDYVGVICDLPKDAIVLSICDIPSLAYWKQDS